MPFPHRMKADEIEVKIPSTLTTSEMWYFSLSMFTLILQNTLHCGTLAFTFPLHLSHLVGVYLCSHERALQSQMCEESVSKNLLFFFLLFSPLLSKFSLHTHCLWQMGLWMWFEFQSPATNKFHGPPPPPKCQTAPRKISGDIWRWNRDRKPFRWIA